MPSQPPQNIFDFVIIGSGLAGLICANILSKGGHKVLVLEKNKQLGGNLQIFTRDKKIFDTGVHYIGGLEPGQNLHSYFSYLGIMENLDLEKMDERGFDSIFLKDKNLNFSIPQGLDNFIKVLSEQFPEEKEGIQAYANRMKNCCENFPLFKIDDSDYTLYEPDMEQSIWDVLGQYFQNPVLKAVLAGNQLLYAGNAENTPFYVHALTQYSYIQSAFKCVKGGNQIALLLAKEIRKHKGIILKFQEVKRLQINKDGEIEFIETHTLEKFYGKHYISNIPPKKIQEMCSGFIFKKVYLRRLESKKETISSFNLYLVLKKNRIPYTNRNVYYVENSKEIKNLEKYTNASWPNCFMLSQSKDKKSPEFCESLSAFTYMHYEEVKEWETSFNTIDKPLERSESYENFKKEKAERFLEKLKHIYPDLNEAIDHIYTSSPLTQRDYLGNMRGEIYGYTKNLNDPYKNLSPPVTPIKNLLQTGQYLNMHGILGVTISAFLTCSEILGKSYLLNQVKKHI